MMNQLRCALSFGLVLAAGARADFSGQSLLGPLSNGNIVTNSTLGKSDDNDGFDSGTHIFNIWDGGDDVWRLNWLGGDMTITLTNMGAGVDNDLFVYSPGSLDSTGDYSVFGGDTPDVVSLLGAAPGMYYINVDSTFFSEGDYQLSVAPAPGSAVLVGCGLMWGMKRRR